MTSPFVLTGAVVSAGFLVVSGLADVSDLGFAVVLGLSVASDFGFAVV